MSTPYWDGGTIVMLMCPECQKYRAHDAGVLDNDTWAVRCSVCKTDRPATTEDRITIQQAVMGDADGWEEYLEQSEG